LIGIIHAENSKALIAGLEALGIKPVLAEAGKLYPN